MDNNITSFDTARERRADRPPPLSDAVQDCMSSEVAYLVAFAAEAIQGLMHSVEGVYSRKAVQP